MVLNLDNWVDVFPMCTPKILRIATKNWDPFFKGKNVTLDPRPINLWGPSFSRGSHLSYESMSHLLLGGACRPQYLNHRNEAKGCCTVADVFAYIFLCVHIHIPYTVFFFQFFIPSYFIRTGVSTFWKWAVFSPFCWDSGYLVNLRDFCYWPLWPSSLWQHGVSGVGKNLWRQNAWNHESSISENKNHPLNLNWKRKNMSCGCVCFIVCFFIFFFADPKSLSLDSLLDFWFPNLAGLKSS